VVIPGASLSLEAQQLAIYVNQILGALDKTVDYAALPEDEASSLDELAGAIRSGEIESLLIMGGNPVYDAPADLDWKALQKSVPEVIRYGYYFDETSLEARNQYCRHALP
jgi:hypothetical protein